MSEMIKMELTVEEITDKHVICNNVKYIIMNRPLSSLRAGDRLTGRYWPDKFSDREDPNRLVLANKYIVDRVYTPVVSAPTVQENKANKADKAQVGKAIA